MTNSSQATTPPPPSSLPLTSVSQNSPYHSLSLHLKQLRLSHMLNHWQSTEQRAIQEQWSYAQFLLVLCQLEADRRFQGRMQRALRVREACA